MKLKWMTGEGRSGRSNPMPEDIRSELKRDCDANMMAFLTASRI